MSSTLNRYLYAIWSLHEKYCCVRSVDVAHYLNLAKPSVSVSVRQLQQQGLIEIDPDGNLSFTASGKILADKLNTRICFFRDLLISAGVEPSLALQDALSFSWNMSDTSFEAFKRMHA